MKSSGTFPWEKLTHIDKHKLLQHFLFAFLFIGFSFKTYSQDLPYELPRDTVDLEERELEVAPSGSMSTLEREQYYSHSPRRASLYSAVLPGLGQAYNRKFWKIPILYIGSGVLVYFIDFNNKEYVKLRSALFSHLNNEGSEDWVSEQVYVPYLDRNVPDVNVRRQIDQYRRDRDYLIIISGLVYMLNIADAMVDAHLKGFDLGEDLSFQVKPSGGQIDNAARYAGISLTLKF
jgi:hypothetical protein